MTTTQLLEKLIGFPTVSRESNLELITFVQDYLNEHGIDSHLVHNPEGTKANLWATIGPQDKAGIILSGHTDVVPVDGQAWSTDPFHAELKEGRIYGRGSTDMKGFLASVLSAVPAFKAAELKRPIHLAFSYDEEVGCQGVPHLIEWLKQQSIQPLACIIGEPTRMKPVIGHKGKMGMRCRVKGYACHSAYAPYGVNAIEYAARMIVFLQGLQEQLKAPEHQDERFDPPFSTIQTGIIHGGNALNIVPAECYFDWEVRSLPHLDVASIEQAARDHAHQVLEKEMQSAEKSTGISFEPLQAYPGLVIDEDNIIAKLVARATGDTDFSTVAFGTEGGLYAQTGINTIVCGPGNMEQGHKADEYIEVDQLERCDAMLAKLMEELSQPE